jgi:hypothetical protein
MDIFACHPTAVKLINQVDQSCLAKHYSPRIHASCQAGGITTGLTEEKGDHETSTGRVRDELRLDTRGCRSSGANLAEHGS